MNAPRLNWSLVLEAQTQVPDGAGGYLRDWQPVGTVWAEMKAGTGREKDAFAVTVSRVPYRIVVRSSPNSSPSRPVAGQRFRKGMRVFNIHAVAEKGIDGRYLTCHTEEEIAS